MRRKIFSLLLVIFCVLSSCLTFTEPVKAATYNFCGKVVSGNVLGQNVQIIFHCSSPYAVIYKGPAPVQNNTWVDVKQAVIQFFSEYLGSYYNGVSYKIVGNLTGFSAITTNLSSCSTCTAFNPPGTSTPTQKPPTSVPATSTFPWYTLTPPPSTATLRVVTATYPPTRTRTVTPLPTATTPATTPTSAVDYNLARLRVDQKMAIIQRLGNLSIKTSLIDIPFRTGLDESKAIDLVNEINGMINSKTLSQSKLDAFHRLILQEQAFESMLPVYADTTSQFVKPLADMAKTIAGYSYVVKYAFGLCKGSACLKAQERLLDLVLKLERNVQVDLTRLIPDNQYYPAELGPKILDLFMRTVRSPLDRGAALKDILVDTALEFHLGGIFLQSYVYTVQEEINKGVQTVRSAPNAGAYPITGKSDRAVTMLNQMVEKAHWANDSAVSRYQDFSRAAAVAEYFQDFTNLLGFNIFPPALLVSTTAKLARLGVNTANMLGSLDDLKCIHYLSQRAGEIAFNAQVPGEDCKYKFSYDILPSGNKVAAGLSQSKAHPLPSQWQQQSSSYQMLLNELTTAYQSGNSQAFFNTLERFSVVENDLTKLMQQYSLKASASQNPGAALGELILNDQFLTTANMSLYISAADFSNALTSGTKPETDFKSAAEVAKNSLDGYSNALKYVDLNPGTDVTLLSFENVSLNLSRLHPLIEGRIKNIGTNVARDIWVVISNGEKEVSTWQMKDILPGETISFSGDIPAGMSTVGVYLEQGFQLLDSRIISAVKAAVPTIAPTQVIPTISRTSTQTTTITRQPITPTPIIVTATRIPTKPENQTLPNVWLAVLVVVALVVVPFIVWKKTKEG